MVHRAHFEPVEREENESERERERERGERAAGRPAESRRRRLEGEYASRCLSEAAASHEDDDEKDKEAQNGSRKMSVVVC